MTPVKFDSIEWRSGMRIAIDNIQTDIVSVDFRSREIAVEDKNGLVWISCKDVTLKQYKR